MKVTRKIRSGNMTIIIIEVEDEQICSYCGKKAECRPYGAGGQQICFECGEKDEEITVKEFDKFMGWSDENE